MRRPNVRWISALWGLAVVACSFPEYSFDDVSNQSAGGASPTGGSLAVTGAGGSESGGSAGTAAGGSLNTGGTGATGGEGSVSSSAGGTGGETSSGGFGGNGGSGGGLGGTGGSSTGGTGGSGGDSGGSGGSGGVGGEGASGGAGGSGGGLIDVGPCGNDLQCLSQQCDSGECRAAHCGSGVVDEDESDADCGGSDCRPCGFDEDCQTDADCASGECGGGSCDPTLQVLCACNSLGACDLNPESIRVDLQLYNGGSETIQLEELTFHYYYSKTAEQQDQVVCNAVNLQGGSCNAVMLESSETSFTDAMANREVVLDFMQGELYPTQMTGAIQFTIQGNGPYQRSDDYSFQGLPTDSSNFVLCDRVVVANADGVPIWGRAPEM